MGDSLFNRVVSDLLERTRSGVRVVIEPRFPGKRLVGGKYRMDSHTVYLYEEAIIAQCGRLFGSADRLEEYAAVVLAHELGHSEDAELAELAEALDGTLTAREEAEIRLRIEENAWRFAQALLTDADPLFVETIVNESLLGYRSKLEPHIA